MLHLKVFCVLGTGAWRNGRGEEQGQRHGGEQDAVGDRGTRCARTLLSAIGLLLSLLSAPGIGLVGIGWLLVHALFRSHPKIKNF
jgi:hypothetical protein